MTQLTKNNWDIHVRYWGISGSVAAPLKPIVITEKIIESICSLVRGGHLNNLDHNNLEATVAQLVQEKLPFATRSTWGGNTTCVEVNTPDGLILLDCGTGVINFGTQREKIWGNSPPEDKKGLLFFSHLHFDHLVGMPFCSLFYNPTNSFDIITTAKNILVLKEWLIQESLFSNALFPPIISQLKAVKNLVLLEEGVPIEMGSTKITPFKLNHPGGSMAYRIERNGKAFVYATDHEQLTETDQALADFAKNADVIYMDGQYLLSEYDGLTPICYGTVENRKGWGHTPMEWCLNTAVAGKIKTLHLGHKDPSRTDQSIEHSLKYMENLNTNDHRIQIAFPYDGMECFI